MKHVPKHQPVMTRILCKLACFSADFYVSECDLFRQKQAVSLRGKKLNASTWQSTLTSAFARKMNRSKASKTR